MLGDFEKCASSLHAKKSFYHRLSIVEFDYSKGSKNHVELNKCCAVRTDELSVIGKVIGINENYMILKTVEIEQLKIMYSTITGMFPCSLPDDYFERNGNCEND